MKLFIPKYVKKIMIALEDSGFETYVVGGAVRDQLLGLAPVDYDVTTNAKPNEIMSVVTKLGGRVIERLGANYGVVAAVLDEYAIEIATFRGECYGSDAHRPATVWFCKTLKEDLARRDFTVNALALDLEGKIIDCFGGLLDLRKRILRTVGEAEMRFSEDALRMFRACRFVAQLDFTYEEELVWAIQKQCKNVRGLSLARVKKELEKLLLSKNCAAGVRLLVRSGLAAESCQLRVNGKKSSVLILPEVAALSGIEQNPLFHRFDVFEHTLQALAYSKAEAEIRWALLLHDLGKGKPEIRIYRTNGAPADPGHEKLSAEMAEGILQRLQFIPTFRRRVVWLVANHMLAGFFLINGMSGGEKWLRRLAGEGTFRSNKEFLQALQQLHNLVLSDMRATNANAEAVQRMQDFWRSLLCLAEELPVHTKELALDGRELGVFVQNAKIGPLANNLLRRVQNGQLQNRADVLMIAAEKWAARYDK